MDGDVVRGGFGDVRFETRNGMRVAVKTLHREGCTTHHEALLMSCLHHPYLPVLLSSTPHEIVMADLGHTSLTEVLQRDAFGRGAYDRIVWCVASALAYMHCNHVHHSDVKCDNVVVDAAGDAVLVDFNLSQHSPTGATSTRCGSLSYACPEIHLNAPSWNAFAADVWSFAVLYFTVLYRHLPFDETYATYGRYVALQPYHGSLRSLRTVWATPLVRKDVLATHETALDAMMQPNPANRPAMAWVERALYYIRFQAPTSSSSSTA